jgi:predicted AAA+ superfamily ATPase
MKRDIIHQLLTWKNSKSRKPLILMGARQVGKTWAMKEFGKMVFKKVAYLVLENNENLEQLFN